MSRFRALHRFRLCCTPQGQGPCLSTLLGATTSIAPTDQSLGGPLPHQLANLPQSHPKVASLSRTERSSVCSLWGIILSFPRLSPALGQVDHVLLSRSPRLLSDLHDLFELQKQCPPAGSTGVNPLLNEFFGRFFLKESRKSATTPCGFFPFWQAHIRLNYEVIKSS